MTVLFFLNSALLGAGLAMDAFSVSLANGLSDPKMSKRRCLIIAGTFAFFQFAMPLVGWVCVRTVAERFAAFQKAIPFIALALLLFIGGELLWEGIKGEAPEESTRLTLRTLIMQGIATSIDALSVGFATAGQGALMAFISSVIIAVVTLTICLVGLYIGKRFGTKLAGKASILGGMILIGIGLEIFITGIMK